MNGSQADITLLFDFDRYQYWGSLKLQKKPRKTVIDIGLPPVNFNTTRSNEGRHGNVLNTMLSVEGLGLFFSMSQGTRLLIPRNKTSEHAVDFQVSFWMKRL